MTAPGGGNGNPGRDGPNPYLNSPGTPALGAPAGMLRTLSVSPWDVNPIPTAINFYRQELANLVLAGAAGSTVVTTIAGGGALQAPNQNIVSIQAVSMFCDSPALTTSITYTVRANGGGIPGLTGLKFPPQTAAYINFPIPGPFNVLQPGAYIDVLITRLVADVANQVNFTLLGWFCTPQDVRRWTGQTPGQIR